MTVEALDPARVTRAAEALAEERVRVAPGPEPGTYLVGSFTGEETYRVTLTPERSCTCPDAAYNGVETCKHVAVVLLEGGGR